MTKVRTKVVVCATVVADMLPLLPQNMTYEVVDFGLLRILEKLHSKSSEGYFPQNPGESPGAP
jgi:hypothetical protein